MVKYFRAISYLSYLKLNCITVRKVLTSSLLMPSFYYLNIADAAKLLKRTYFSGGLYLARLTGDLSFLLRST